MNTLKQVAAKLADLRGRHNLRVLDEGDLLQALNEAQRTGYGVRAGETVGRCFTIPAFRMRLLAVRGRRCYGILMDWGNASGTYSPVPIYGGYPALRKLLPHYRRAGFPWGEGWYRLSFAEVHAVLDARRAIAAAQHRCHQDERRTQ